MAEPVKAVPVTKAAPKAEPKQENTRTCYHCGAPMDPTKLCSVCGTR